MADEGKPLEILPWGRDLEAQAKLDRKKAKGRRGGFGCLLYAVAFALVAVYCCGWIQGQASKPFVNESPVSVGHRTTATEPRK